MGDRKRFPTLNPCGPVLTSVQHVDYIKGMKARGAKHNVLPYHHPISWKCQLPTPATGGPGRMCPHTCNRGVWMHVPPHLQLEDLDACAPTPATGGLGCMRPHTCNRRTWMHAPPHLQPENLEACTTTSATGGPGSMCPHTCN